MLDAEKKMHFFKKSVDKRKKIIILAGMEHTQNNNNGNTIRENFGLTCAVLMGILAFGVLACLCLGLPFGHEVLYATGLSFLGVVWGLK